MSDTEQELVTLQNVTVITTTSNGQAEELNLLVPPGARSTSNHQRQKSSDSARVKTRIDGFAKHLVERKADLTWEDLCLEVRMGRKKSRKKSVLKSVNGYACPGQMTCVIGQSGSGKTSLLNCLTGYCTEGVQGKISVNGSSPKKRKFRGLRVYVPENHYLLQDMSTEETLGTAIDLKAPRHLSPAEKKAHLQRVLEESGLYECRKTRCSQLTEDSKSRLCMVQELVGIPPPPLLVFDNPIRGMGQVSSLWCMQFLRRFAKSGHTVIISIPRPSSQVLNLFDQLYILSEGRCLYGGPVADLVSYLSNQGAICPQYCNPIDYAIEVSSTLESSAKPIVPNTGKLTSIEEHATSSQITTDDDDIEEDAVSLTDGKMQYSCVFAPITLDEFKLYPASRSTQFFVLTLRTLRLKWRDPLTTAYRLVAHIVYSLLIGLLYFGVGNNKERFAQNNSLLFFNIFFLVITAMIPSIFTVPREVIVFLQEQTNTTYSATISLLARTVAELPFKIILPVISGSIVYWMSSQPPEADRFLYFLFLCVLTTLVAQSLALVIAIAVPDVQTGLLTSISLVMPLLLFCGFFKPIPQIPDYLHWISYLSFIRYAYEGVLLTVYTSSLPSYTCNLPECPPPHLAPFLPIGISSLTEVPSSENWRNILALFGFLILFRFMSYGALKWKLYFR